MLEIKKVILVAGAGGARTDFIAGWLGILPLFLDGEWRIDPLTGQSHGFMRYTKLLDYGTIDSFSNFFKEFFTINPAADLYYAGSMHGHQVGNFLGAINTNQAELLVVDTSTVSPAHVRWEFIVKTYLSQLRTRYAFETNTTWQIDRSINKTGITNADRITLVEQHLQNIKNQPYNTSPINGLPPHKKLNYNLLFQLGGSKYLCDILNLPEVDKQYHTFWDSQLLPATSPDSLTVWGRTWNKADYFSD
jgi:hypothetical protein